MPFFEERGMKANNKIQKIMIIFFFYLIFFFLITKPAKLRWKTATALIPIPLHNNHQFLFHNFLSFFFLSLYSSFFSGSSAFFSSAGAAAASPEASPPSSAFSGWGSGFKATLTAMGRSRREAPSSLCVYVCLCVCLCVWCLCGGE